MQTKTLPDTLKTSECCMYCGHEQQTGVCVYMIKRQAAAYLTVNDQAHINHVNRRVHSPRDNNKPSCYGNEKLPSP